MRVNGPIYEVQPTSSLRVGVFSRKLLRERAIRIG